MPDTDFYGPQSPGIVSRTLADGTISDAELDLIEEFVAERRHQRNISKLRADSLLRILVWWREKHLPVPYTSARIGDIYAAKSSMDEAGYTPSSRVQYLHVLKMYLLWLIEGGHSEIPKAKIDALKLPETPHGTVEAEEVLTDDEVMQLIKACRSSRDRALVAVLYESGCRIGELGVLRWSQVRLDEYGFSLSLTPRTSKKTEKSRYVRLLMAREYLAAWKNDYPGDPAGDAPVFLNNRGKPFRYRGLYSLIRRIKERSGLEKNVHPHLFRHSRVTHLLQQGVSESVIKKVHWGDVNTKMLACYGHLCDQDIDDEMMRAAGIEKPEKKRQRRLAPIQCPGCDAICAPEARFCSVCGIGLTEDATKTMNQSKKFVADDEEIQKENMRRMILEMKARGEI